MDVICGARARINAALRSQRKAHFTIKALPASGPSRERNALVNRELRKFCDERKYFWNAEGGEEAPSNSLSVSRVTAANQRWTNGVFGVRWWLSRVAAGRASVARAKGDLDLPFDLWMADDFAERPELALGYKVVAFSEMRKPDAKRRRLLERLAEAGVAAVFLDPKRHLSPAEFAEAVRKAGGYVPSQYGLVVDMNGRFMSVHAMRGGHYDFKLPRECEAVNAKTGAVEARGRTLPLDLLAGETCWFWLR